MPFHAIVALSVWLAFPGLILLKYLWGLHVERKTARWLREAKSRRDDEYCWRCHHRELESVSELVFRCRACGAVQGEGAEAWLRAARGEKYSNLPEAERADRARLLLNESKLGLNALQIEIAALEILGEDNDDAGVGEGRRSRLVTVAIRVGQIQESLRDVAHVMGSAVEVPQFDIQIPELAALAQLPVGRSKRGSVDEHLHRYHQCLHDLQAVWLALTEELGQDAGQEGSGGESAGTPSATERDAAKNIIADLEHALAQPRKSRAERSDIHRRLAGAYLTLGAVQRALDELEKAFRIKPDNVAALTELAKLALDVGDLRRAQRMFQALLLQKLDDSSPITRGEVFQRLAEVYERLGENSKAARMLEHGVSERPGRAVDGAVNQPLPQVRAARATIFSSDERAELKRWAPSSTGFTLLVVALFSVIVGKDCRSYGDAAARQSEIMACGAPNCALRRIVGGAKRGDRGHYTYYVRRATTDGGSEVMRISMDCPRKYWIVGAHECHVLWIRESDIQIEE